MTRTYRTRAMIMIRLAGNVISHQRTHRTHGAYNTNALITVQTSVTTPTTIHVRLENLQLRRVRQRPGIILRLRRHVSARSATNGLRPVRLTRLGQRTVRGQWTRRIGRPVPHHGLPYFGIVKHHTLGHNETTLSLGTITGHQFVFMVNISIRHTAIVKGASNLRNIAQATFKIPTIHANGRLFANMSSGNHHVRLTNP